MIERRVLVPVGPEALWKALTEPAEVAAWFGHDVEWELAPGGQARWTRPDGGDRRVGVVDDVVPGRRLSFRWWPESGDEPASAVTYEVEPSEEDDAPGSRLTVRETPIPQPAEACASALATDHGVEWSPWDTRAAGLWVRLHAGVRVTT